MILVGMIKTDEDAFICDMAETYHIFDYKSMPLRTVATLAAGLPKDSRIRRKITGAKERDDMLMLALIHDRIMDILKYITGSEVEPVHIYDRIMETNKKPATGFGSPEEYEEARKKFVKGG